MNLKTLSGCVALLTIVLLVGGGCALQEDLVTVNSRVTSQSKKAEADRAALRAELARSEETYRNQYADLRALMNDLREDVQALRGQLEESGYNAQQRAESEARRQEQWKKGEKQLQTSLDRIIRLEAYLGMEPSEKLLPPEAAATARHDAGKPTTEQTPDGLYAAAKQQFDRGEYEDARQGFQALLEQHPKSDHADNAQFWLGEVYYHEKWYEKAILEYQKVIENYPKGNKVRSALLKQGLAFSNLGDGDNAKLILKELVRKYPNSKEANIAEKKLKTLQ
ncbi:MAG: tol-pal system protein YbgF [Deltaproteobacteria bacterium]|jgi:tol-pal system protein YbgF